MSKESDMVKAFYSKGVEFEWNRLVRDDYHQLEYSTTLRFLKEYLPESGISLTLAADPEGIPLNWPGRVTI